MKTEDLILLGVISKTHGYSGNLKLEFSNSDFSLNEYKEPVYLLFNNKPVPFFIDYYEDCGNYALIKFEDVTSGEKAAELTNHELYVQADKYSNIDEEDELTSLLGYQLIDENSGNVGTITNFYSNSFQDTLVVLNGEKEVLVPFVDEFIISISDSNKTIYCKLPDGLIDIQSA